MNLGAELSDYEDKVTVDMQCCAVITVVWLVCKVNPPSAVAQSLMAGNVDMDLSDCISNPNATHQVDLPFEPLGPLAMWARWNLNHESINLKFSSKSEVTLMALSSKMGLDFPILDSGATSSGVNKRDALVNTYSDRTVVGGALGKYSVCSVRGDCPFTAYDRNSKK